MGIKSFFKKALPVLKGIAPAAAAALSGPYAPVVFGLTKRLLGDTEMTDEDVLSRIAGAKPEDLIRIRGLDAELEIKREELGIRREEMYLHDLQSARERHMAVRDPEPARLTYMAMAALVATVFAFVAMPELPPEMAYLFGVLTGGLLELIGKGYNFYLGSSSGSKIKTEQIAAQMAALRSQAPD